MKILVVTTSFPLKPGDSLSPFLWEYCLRLRKRGWEVTVVVPHHKGVKPEETWDGIRIKRFKYLPENMENMAYSGGLLPGLKKNPLSIIKIPFFIHAMYRETLRTVSEERFDLVNFHWLFPAAFWARRFFWKSRIPVVFTGHGTDIHLATKFPFSKFAESALAISRGLTLNSDYMRDILKELSLPPGVAVIPMGTDIDKFKPGGKRASESGKVLFIGRLIKQKGVDILLEAYKKVQVSFSGATMEIIGYGPEKDWLFNYVKILGLSENVKFSEAVSHDMLIEKYRSARLLALPSLVGEGFGMTAAEAAACGIPTITFGLGGTGELVVNNETGMIVDQNAESLGEGLIKLFSDDELTDRLGRNARKRIEQYYGWDIISEKFDVFFKRVLSSK
jgi:glycosyltransferase involved in cell wall biosynthesis